MKPQCYLLALSALFLLTPTLVSAETVTLSGKDYQMNKLISKDIGPGTNYTRWRIPEYPLNVNVLTVDLNNPYACVETMQANESLGTTELLEHASARLTAPMHKALGGANGNFWCVSGQQPWSDLLIGTSFGGNVRNGKIITETNAYSDQWCGGPQATCVIACDSYKHMWIEPMHWKGTISSPKIPTTEVIQINKVVRENELGLYNNFYPAAKVFQPVNQVDNHFVITTGDATEVYLKLVEGQKWTTGTSMRAIVTEVRQNAGNGNLGQSDLALVGRGGYAAVLNQLTPGDEITFDNGWTSYSNGQRPVIENLLQGLSLCMKDGVKIAEGNDNSYNNTSYPRTAYGSSADGKTLYIITADKATDPVYGSSAGCNTDVICDIAATLGCANLSAVDGGGSTQMLVEGKVINKTTESNPRPVANGWMVFSTAPESSEIVRLEFADTRLRVPPYSSSMPAIIAYNQYGDIVDDLFMDFELNCDPSLGQCEGNTFIAGRGPNKGILTASYNGISVSKEIEIVESQVKVKLNPILIDNSREYFVEVVSLIDDKEFNYDPTELSWTSDDPDIAFVDHHGLLHGLKEGSTIIRGSIGDFSDEVPVTVEIAPTPIIKINDWDNWKTTAGSGIKVNSWNGGNLGFNYSSPRLAKITFTKEQTVYSLPDRQSLTFTSSIPVKSIDVDLRTRNDSKSNTITVTPAEEETLFSAGISHTVDIPLPGEVWNLATYPISLYKIAFNLDKNSSYNGQHTIQLDYFGAHYNHYSSVEKITTDHEKTGSVRYYNLQGIQVDEKKLSPGVYIRMQGTSGRKVIIR